MITFYHQTKTSIDFWYRRRLNHRPLIQLSKTLLVELIETHHFSLIEVYMCVKLISGDLNLDPYLPHPTSTYTCEVIFTPRVHSSNYFNLSLTKILLRISF